MGEGHNHAEQQLVFACHYTDTCPTPEARQQLSGLFRQNGYSREDVKFFQAFVAPLGNAAGELRNIVGYHARSITAAKADKEAIERAALNAEEVFQCGLIRCIFGNPFRLATADPAWLTSDVRILAEDIYRDRAFDRLPILADALQDAGCENADILNHCRGDGPHVRGCWVVDLLLGKE